jgi:hypothetical protein
VLLYAKNGVGLCRWTGEVNKSDGQGLLVLLCCMLHGSNSQFRSFLKNVQKSRFAAERGVEFSPGEKSVDLGAYTHISRHLNDLNRWEWRFGRQA